MSYCTLMSETIEGLRDMFLRWKEAFERSKGLKVNLGRNKVMVSSGITNDGLSKSEVDSSRFCSLRVNANSVLFVQCGKWLMCQSGMDDSKVLHRFYMQKI